MRAYQFIKYNKNTNLEKYIPTNQSNFVICFDLEDSIQDLKDSKTTPALKEYYRDCLKTIFSEQRNSLKRIKTGIRINAFGSEEYFKDIDLLVSINNISSIFLPKVSAPGDIANLQSKLMEKSVCYDEIIPVIETKSGRQSIQKILDAGLDKIKSIAFGHCDYNSDNRIYPFFHHDSREYWSWVSDIFNRIKSSGINFINSPYLQLGNNLFFEEMLGILSSICKGQAEQITLTHEQTNICNNYFYDERKKSGNKLFNTLDLKVNGQHARNFIEAFESNADHKGFAITEDRKILSPHEYKSAQGHEEKTELPRINFTFVGGCFPVQGEISFEDRFHQLLKRKIESKVDVLFNVNIVRYERLKNSIDKISASNAKRKMDLLIFSVRPEPFLRLSKLYYKFRDTVTGRRKRSINVSLFNRMSPEENDMLTLDSGTYLNSFKERSLIHKVMINANYFLGALLGNHRHALKKYLTIVIQVKEFCEINNIQFILMGPALRTNTWMERLLSKRLDSFIEKNLPGDSNNYIKGSFTFHQGRNLFDKNGIHANENYHRLISDMMMEKVMNVLPRINSNKNDYCEEQVPTSIEGGQVIVHASDEF